VYLNVPLVLFIGAMPNVRLFGGKPVFRYLREVRKILPRYIGAPPNLLNNFAKLFIGIVFSRALGHCDPPSLAILVLKI
jgi:hypothetical protein